MQAIAQTGSMPGTTYVSIGQIKALGAKLELPAATAGCDIAIANQNAGF